MNNLAAPIRRIRHPLSSSGRWEIIWALRHISLEVKRGEAVGIIGRNGAGKSTLLKILSRIIEPNEGSAEIRGRVGSLLEVGTGFHPELTGRENIYLNGSILGMKRCEIKAKFDEIVAFSETDKFLDTPVKHYSSGMIVRLAFAVAAHLEPEILLVDEVLAVGDAEFQKKCLRKMGDTTKEGRSILFVSHNIPAAVTLCDRLIWIDQGMIHSWGEPQAIAQKYLSDDVTSSASVQFEDNPNNPAQITQIELIDPQGKPATSLEVNDQVEIKTRFRLQESLSGYRLSVIVSLPDGFEALQSHSDDKTPPEKLCSGNYLATMFIPGRLLAPGQYSISVALVDQEGTTLDHQTNILSFNLSGYPFGKSQRRYGLLAYPFQWEIQAIIPDGLTENTLSGSSDNPNTFSGKGTSSRQRG